MKIPGISKLRVEAATIEVLQASGWLSIDRRHIADTKYPSLSETIIRYFDGRRVTLNTRDFDIHELNRLRDMLDSDRKSNRNTRGIYGADESHA